MWSRREFLIGLFLLAPMVFLKKSYAGSPHRTKGKFLKRGWLLQEGDV